MGGDGHTHHWAITEELGMADSSSPLEVHCPNCKAMLPDEAVLCVACGYHLKEGLHVANITRPDADVGQASSHNPYRSPSSAPSSRVRPFALIPLFTINGRITRLQWWTVQLVWFFAMAVLGGLMENAFVPEWFGVLTFWICIWPVFAAQIKRWHDINKSGLWCFINLIPCVGPLWALIELGFQRGTKGPNGYGDDPIS